jgi:hypothetical protein
MAIFICNRCQQRFLTQDRESDFQHICNSGNPTLDQEDKSDLFTRWDDYSGSGGLSLGDIQNQGMKNKLDGSRAGIEGNRLGEFTRRGNKAENTRQRQHINHIELNK